MPFKELWSFGRNGGNPPDYYKAKALFEQGMRAASKYRCGEAIDLYTKSIKAHANPSPYINRAKIFTWRGRYYEALQDLMEARKLDLAQGQDFIATIDEEIYKVKSLCTLYLDGKRDAVLAHLDQAEQSMYGRSDALDQIWSGVLRDCKKSHLYNRLRRFHFFNEIDSIKKFNGFELYPETAEWCEAYPEAFVEREIASCPDPVAYTMVSAHIGTILCILDEARQAHFRESSLYGIHGEMMDQDYGNWGTLDSEDPGIIRDAAEFREQQEAKSNGR